MLFRSTNGSSRELLSTADQGQTGYASALGAERRPRSLATTSKRLTNQDRRPFAVETEPDLLDEIRIFGSILVCKLVEARDQRQQGDVARKALCPELPPWPTGVGMRFSGRRSRSSKALSPRCVRQQRSWVTSRLARPSSDDRIVHKTQRLTGKEHLDNALSSRLRSHAAANYPLVLIEFFVDPPPSGEAHRDVVGPLGRAESVLPIA